ncbi:MAG: hypothetical protein AAGM22_32095 [Acidobacteriota bacterium]
MTFTRMTTRAPQLDRSPSAAPSAARFCVPVATAQLTAPSRAAGLNLVALASLALVSVVLLVTSPIVPGS